MEFEDIDKINCDVLVVGGGGAGLRAGISAAKKGADVRIASKTKVGSGNNTYISKGVWASSGWGDKEDNPRKHLRDTILGGRFITDQNLAASMVEEVVVQAAFLEKCGAELAKKDGRIKTSNGPGHSLARHIRGINKSGRDLAVPLKTTRPRLESGLTITSLSPGFSPGMEG